MNVSLLTPLSLMISLSLASAATQAPKASPQPAAKSPAAAPAPSTNTVAAIPQSVFVVPQSSRDGRNPFFPSAKWGVETPRPKEAPTVVTFVLNGITSPPRRTAMINGRTFEPGETGEIRLSNGNKVMITCAEVRDDCAVITYGGERRELRFKSGI